MPEAARHRAKGSACLPLRSRQGCLPLPSPVISSSSWKARQAQEGKAGWPLSKLIEPQPAAARQPRPGPGCVQGLALKRLQSGEKDVDLRSGCRSSSSLIKPGRNRSTCSGTAPCWEVAQGCFPEGSAGCAGLSRLTPSHFCSLDACHSTGMARRAGEGRDAHRLARNIWLSPF